MYVYYYPIEYKQRKTFLEKIGRIFKYIFIYLFFIISIYYTYPDKCQNAYNFVLPYIHNGIDEYNGLCNGTIDFNDFATDCLKFYLKHNIGILLELF